MFSLVNDHRTASTVLLCLQSPAAALPAACVCPFSVCAASALCSVTSRLEPRPPHSFCSGGPSRLIPNVSDVERAHCSMILRILGLLVAIFITGAEKFSDSPVIFTTKGVLIDAGRSGSSIHIYSWKPRVYSTLDAPISTPNSDHKRVSPGIDTLASTPDTVASYLSALMDFAKISLAENESDLKNFPIYFKATAGMREVEAEKRDALLSSVRKYLSDKGLCPFYFRNEFARVILDDNDDADFNRTFAQFGVASARAKHLTEIADRVVTDNNLEVRKTRPASSTLAPSAAVTNHKPLSVVNPCFHAGYKESTPDTSGEYAVDVVGPVHARRTQLDQCMRAVKAQMGLGTPISVIHWESLYFYQGPYAYPWKFFMLPQTVSLELFKERAESICAMNFGDVLFYFENNNLAADPDKLNTYLPYYCFLSSYILVLLQDGYRFPMDEPLTVLNAVNNSWPDESDHQSAEMETWIVLLAAVLCGLSGGAFSAYCYYLRTVKVKVCRTSSADSFDFESINRTPTLDLLVSQDDIGIAFPSRRSSGNSSPPDDGSPFKRKSVAGVFRPPTCAKSSPRNMTHGQSSPRPPTPGQSSPRHSLLADLKPAQGLKKRAESR